MCISVEGKCEFYKPTTFLLLLPIRDQLTTMVSIGGSINSKCDKYFIVISKGWLLISFNSLPSRERVDSQVLLAVYLGCLLGECCFLQAKYFPV